MFRALLGGQVQQPINCTFITRDGRRLSLEGQLNVVFAAGIPLVVRGIVRDVSERNAAEQARQELDVTLETRISER